MNQPTRIDPTLLRVMPRWGKWLTAVCSDPSTHEWVMLPGCWCLLECAQCGMTASPINSEVGRA